MATVGETRWKELIARRIVTEDLFAEVRGCYLSFSFGPWTRFFTKEVPIRDFFLGEYEFPVSSRMRPGVYLHFRLKVPYMRASRSVKFRLVWPHYWITRKGVLFCVFPRSAAVQLKILAGPDSGKYKKVKKFFLSSSPMTRQSRFTLTLTPLKLFNLSLTTPLLKPVSVSTGESPRVSVLKVKTPYARKLGTPRPNPEAKYKTFFYASEYANPWQNYQESAVEREVHRRSWTGVTTPGFGGRTKFQLPDNPHTVDMYTTKLSDGYDLRRTYANPTTTFANGWGPDIFTFQSAPVGQNDPFFLDCENAAISRLNSQANAGIQANLAQTMGEYRQFGSMVKSTANRLVKSIRALKRGQFSKAADALFDGSFNMQGVYSRNRIRPGNPTKSKSLARNWLELQYGWKPLLHDAYEGARSLFQFLEEAGRTQTVLGTAVRNRITPFKIFGPASQSVPVGREIVNTFLQTKFGVTYQIRPDNFSALAQFGFTNPINLIWELLPYSFVVDWFLPIGPFLESVSGPHSVEFIKGYKTRFGRRYNALDVNFSGPMPGAPSVEYRAFQQSSRLSITLSRTVLLGWPTARFPQLKNPLSEMHILNALALLRVAFRD